jgi:hypothetical protein
MVLAYILGIGLIGSGCFLLCHHGYSHMNLTKQDPDPEAPETGEKKQIVPANDCCLPICFFQASQIYNHETWIVVCLLCGSIILLMTLTAH